MADSYQESDIDIAEKQQEQIYSLSNSLEQFAKYIQHSQNASNENTAQLSTSLEEIRTYLIAIASNMDVLKEDVDRLKDLNENEQQTKAIKSLSDKHHRLSESVSALNNSQKAFFNQLPTWRSIAIAVGIASLGSACASFIGFKIAIAGMEDRLKTNDAVLAGGIQLIREKLGID